MLEANFCLFKRCCCCAAAVVVAAAATPVNVLRPGDNRSILFQVIKLTLLS